MDFPVEATVRNRAKRVCSPVFTVGTTVRGIPAPPARPDRLSIAKTSMWSHTGGAFLYTRTPRLSLSPEVWAVFNWVPYGETTAQAHAELIRREEPSLAGHLWWLGQAGCDLKWKPWGFQYWRVRAGARMLYNTEPYLRENLEAGIVDYCLMELRSLLRPRRVGAALRLSSNWDSLQMWVGLKVPEWCEGVEPRAPGSLSSFVPFSGGSAGGEVGGE